jgi:putative ABC transport system permease protein
VLRDVRYGVRSLRRSPGLVAAAVAALALGIGLTTVMFSVIYGLLIKGLPFDDPARIAMIYRVDPTGRGQEDLIPFGDFVRYQSAQRSFVAFGAYSQGAASLSGADRPERVNVARMTAGVFGVTGVRPVIGRTFSPADNAPDAPPTAVLGYAIWRDRFARDPNVANKPVRVSGRAYTIIGVMPEGFEFPTSQQLWLSLQLDPVAVRPGEGTGLIVVARLREGVEYARANAELLGLSRRLATEFADTGAVRTGAQPFIRARVPLRVYSLLYAMLGAVFVVLLVACANVANLLLDRAANRTREIGIRIALGASRAAVVRQSLVESSILAGLAAIVGAALAQAGIVMFNRAIVEAGEVPFWMDIRLHVPVLMFVLGAAMLASVVSGLLPAVHSARLDINTILKDESHAASSMRVGKLSRAIVVGEIALSSMMLVGAGFMTKSIVQLRSVAPRFAADDVVTARVSLSSVNTVEQRRFFETLEHNLAAEPGMDGVYVGNDLPGTGWRGDRVAIEGHVYSRAQDYPVTRWLAVSPGFFRTFGVSAMQGRTILASDRVESQRVAVVSEAFARQRFADGKSIGKRIRLGAPSSRERGEWLTIVGVVPTLYAASAVSASGDHFPPEVLTAFWQERQWPSASIAMRGSPSAADATTLRKIVAGLDAETPVYAVSRMKDVLAKPMWPARVFGTMFVIFGVASLVLAAIGLYAVMAFSVSRRLREMGIRMALGATSGAVIRLVCRQGAAQILIGMLLGLAAGSGLARLMRTLLFEVQPSDPTVFALVAGVLGTAAFAACIIPAIGATRVDPTIALRTE